ncbi:MAG: ABC transporter permease, partial [Acidobacteria bacterium]|nr:ABC transporter permease [Acidobacteriota bacterium]
MWRQVYARLRSLWRWRKQESELDDEIRFHLAEEMEERIAAGMSPEQARAAARRDFGNVPLIRELTRETWGWGAAERLGQDARSAVRMMRRNPGYTCAVVVTLALGIGLNAAMYGLLSRLFLQAPPHIQNPDGIHRVYVRQRNVFNGRVSTRNQLDWSEFTALRADTAGIAAAAGSTYPRAMPNGRGQAAENLHVAWVDGEFFALLGVRPALGRPIGPEDDDLAATPVALIGDGYARRRFGLAREALGATVSFDDVTYEIVGVLPPGFSGPDPSAADVWLPVRIALPASRGPVWAFRSGFSLMPFVRLAPGVTAEAAGAAATAALRASRVDSPMADRVDTEATLLLGPLLLNRGPSADGQADLRLPLVVGGVALVVLLVAVANVTNLLMLRVAARRRELAVRNALGAGRWAVGRLLVIESVLLAALSGGAALAVAPAAGRVLRVNLLPRYNWAGGPVDAPLMAFTGVTVLLVGLAAALAPALYAARTRGLDRLDGLRGARAGSPVRSFLIGAQAALSIVLLVGGALFLRSFEAARRVDIGYAKENLLTVNLVGGGLRSLFGGMPLDETAVQTMETRVRAMPGVVEVAQGTSTPLSSRMAIPLRVDGLDRLPFGEGPYVSFVTPGFFWVAGLGIREGRSFAEGDGAGAPRVAVVNTAFARRAWPGARAIGRCLFVGGDAALCATVVGVVETPLERGLGGGPIASVSGRGSSADAADIPQYYLPLAQAASDAATAGTALSQRALVLRTRGDPERMVRPVLLALAEVFPDLPRSNVQSLPAALAPQLRTWRIGTALFGAAALLALLLAAVGLYAVVAFGVRQRELEFGIRRALGARSWHLLRLVMAR